MFLIVCMCVMGQGWYVDMSAVAFAGEKRTLDSLEAELQRAMNNLYAGL